MTVIWVAIYAVIVVYRYFFRIESHRMTVEIIFSTKLYPKATALQGFSMRVICDGDTRNDTLDWNATCAAYCCQDYICIQHYYSYAFHHVAHVMKEFRLLRMCQGPISNRKRQ
jgi:hypothetical protein